MKNLKSKLFSIVASILLISVVSGGLYAFADTTTPISYVLQPGIELIVNQEGIVTDVETLNATAETVLGDLDLINLTVEAAIVKAVQHMETLGYTYSVDDILVTENENDVKKIEKLYDKLEKLLQNNQNPKNLGNQATIEEDDDETEINVPNHENAKGYRMVQAAREIEGMNPGKYNIIMNKMGKNPLNYANKTNQEIMKEYVVSK